MSEYETAYVGTYTDGIYRCRVDPNSGVIERVDATEAGENPAFLAVHPSGTSLYAVNEVNDGAVTAFEIGSSGDLSRINRVASGGAGPCHLSVERTGQYVLVAHYASGSVSMLPVAENGGLGEASHVVEHEGSSVNPERQDRPHVHSVTPGPDNGVAYVADLGTDELVVYDMDLDDGRLEREGSVTVRDGAGPRHVDVHPDGSVVYLLNELDSTVLAFERDGEAGLSVIGKAETLPADFGGDNLAAEVQVHPSGEFVYASNRGHDSIAVLTVDGAGRPEPAGHARTGGEYPRNFAIAPDGRFLFAENRHTSDVHTFRIDRESGGLDPTGDATDVPRPACMRFVR